MILEFCSFALCLVGTVLLSDAQTSSAGQLANRPPPAAGRAAAKLPGLDEIMPSGAPPRLRFQAEMQPTRWLAAPPWALNQIRNSGSPGTAEQRNTLPQYPTHVAKLRGFLAGAFGGDTGPAATLMETPSGKHFSPKQKQFVAQSTRCIVVSTSGPMEGNPTFQIDLFAVSEEDARRMAEAYLQVVDQLHRHSSVQTRKFMEDTTAQLTACRAEIERLRAEQVKIIEEHKALADQLGIEGVEDAPDLVGPAISSTVGHWRFEEGAADVPAGARNTIRDSSGNGLHGTAVHGPVYRVDVPASSVSPNTLSLEFDGNSGHRVTVPDGPLVTLTHSLTLEAFIKARPLKPGTGGFGVIVLRADTRPGLDPYTFGIQSPGNIVSFQIQNTSQQVARLDAPIPYDQWLHVAGTLDDATGAMKLYVNGEQVASMTTAIRPLEALDPAWSPGLSIGNDYTGQYGGCFNGLIDEVRISDVALPPSRFLPESESPRERQGGSLTGSTAAARQLREELSKERHRFEIEEAGKRAELEAIGKLPSDKLPAALRDMQTQLDVELAGLLAKTRLVRTRQDQVLRMLKLSESLEEINKRAAVLGPKARLLMRSISDANSSLSGYPEARASIRVDPIVRIGPVEIANDLKTPSTTPSTP